MTRHTDDRSKIRVRNIDADGPWKAVVFGGFVAVAGAIRELAEAVALLAEAVEKRR